MFMEIIQEFKESAEHREITVTIIELSSPGVKDRKILKETMESEGQAG